MLALTGAAGFRQIAAKLQPIHNAGVMELADVLDSKSSGSDTVRVRPPPPAPEKSTLRGAFFNEIHPCGWVKYRFAV